VPSPSAQQTQHDMCKEAIKPKPETLTLIPPNPGTLPQPQALILKPKPHAYSCVHTQAHTQAQTSTCISCMHTNTECLLVSLWSLCPCLLVVRVSFWSVSPCFSSRKTMACSAFFFEQLRLTFFFLHTNVEHFSDNLWFTFPTYILRLQALARCAPYIQVQYVLKS
jgi:hypothetical protein